MTRRSPATSAGPVTFTTRTCGDCVPPLQIQGGEWGWQAHRHRLHGEGDDPGPHPGPTSDRTPPANRWTEADRVAFHQRNRVARRRRRAGSMLPRSVR